MTATRQNQSNMTTDSPVLLLAFELSASKWLLGFGTGLGKCRRVELTAGDTPGLAREIALAKSKFLLPADARVVSVYEAGRDGFWIHRWLAARGIQSQVVDSASIEVDRRHRRAKTDRLDVEKLLNLLARQQAGEAQALKPVHVPTPEEEDRRQLHRELEVLKQEQGEHVVRIGALLATLGLPSPQINREFPLRLAELRQVDGAPVPPGLRERLLREFRRWQLVHEQILELERQRANRIRTAETRDIAQVRQLLELRGIGLQGAWIFTQELFAWRNLQNRRQVGAIAGLTGTPYASGDSAREQGISKAGNRRVRTLAVELAWLWLNYQPQSALSRWFSQRFGQGKRQRKIGIVALARKLLIALWRWVTHGEVPEGAVLVDWQTKLRIKPATSSLAGASS
jgi:transposase